MRHIAQLPVKEAPENLLKFQTLPGITRSVVAVDCLSEMLQAVVDSVAKALPADRVSLITFDLEMRQVIHFVKGGPGADQIIPVSFDELWQGLSGWALRESKPALSYKVRSDPRESLTVQQRRAQTHCGSIVVVPLQYGDRTLGTITAINRPEQPDFSQRDVALIVTMAHQAAIAIENARMLQDKQKNEEFLRSVVNNTPVIIFAFDREGVITLSEGEGLESLGLQPGQAVGQSMFELYQDQPFFLEKIRLALTGEEQFAQGEIAGVTLEGYLTPIRDEDGQVIGVVGLATDITKQQKAQDELKQSKEFLDNIINALDDPVFVKDAQHRWLLLNDSACDMMGHPREALIGKSDYDLSPKEEADIFWEQDELVLETEETKINEETVTWRGKSHTISTKKSVFKDPVSKEKFIVGTIRDITERKQAEQRLQRQSRLLQGVAEATSSLLTSEDTNSAINQALALLGESAGVDRVYIFENQPISKEEYSVVSQRFEWVAEDIEPQIDNPELQFLAWHEVGFKRWYETLSAGGIIAGAVLEFPKEEQELLEAQQILSLLAVPIFIDNEFWGFIGFDDCQTERQWTIEETTILRSMAASIGGALAREEAEAALALARDEALSAAKVKSEFLTNMSHEIRTPLNAVLGMTGLLLDTELDCEQRDFAETIRTSGDSLLAIINDILDLSKIEAEKLELEMQPFDLRSCVEEALDLVATKAAEKELDLAYLVEDQIPTTFIGDVTRLRQILVNLLSNAVKFTESGEVVVTVNAQELANKKHQLRFAVRDTGIGISQEKQNRLFKTFSQVDNSTTRRYGGTGLGLAISKRLAELMEGTMWVESEVEEGSTFYFTIVVEPTAEQQHAYLQHQQPELRDKRILIVDDNETNRRILNHQTQTWGMHSETVASGPEALQLVQQEMPFDLAILDMQMPDMDGLSLATEIRKYRDAETLPLIMLTSLGRREENGAMAHFAAHLTKPIKPSQLHDVLNNVVAGRPASAQKYVSRTQFDESMGKRHPLRILLAEDNIVNQKVAVSILERLGYRADVVANGLEVLEALHRQPYDLVLMDIQMPEMDGVEATQRIQQEQLPFQPRIVAMTANALETDRRKYLEAGMDDYVSKPIQVNELIEALNQCEPHANQRNGTTPTVETSPEPTATTSAAIDFSVLNKFQQMMGDETGEIVKELASVFIEDAPDLLTKIRQGFDQGDADQLWRAAHTLKSSSANLGAMGLSTHCEELEELGRAGTLEGMGEKIAQAEAEFKQARQALETKI